MMPSVFDFVQSVQIGLQNSLFRELHMALPSANKLAADAAKDIEELLEITRKENPLETKQDTMLYAVKVEEPAKWKRITPDSFVHVVDAELGSIWVVVDVMHFVNKVAAAVAAKDPEFFAAEARKRKARRN